MCDEGVAVNARDWMENVVVTPKSLRRTFINVQANARTSKFKGLTWILLARGLIYLTKRSHFRNEN